MIVLNQVTVGEWLGNWIFNLLLIYAGMRLERWNVKRRAEKEAARKWYDSQGPKEPTL